MTRVDAYITQIEARKRKRWRRAPIAFAYFLLMVLAVVLIETTGENWMPIALLIQAPMLFLLFVPILGLVVAAVRRSYIGAVLNLGSIALALYLVSPIWFKGPRIAQSPTFTVATFNIEHMRQGRPELLAALREKSADAILMQEATELSRDEQFRSKAYEGYEVHVSEHIAIASRYPIDELREIQFHYLLDFEKNKSAFGPDPWDHGYAQIAKVRWSGQHIYLVNTHLSPSGYSREAPEGLDAIQLMARTLRYRKAQANALRNEIAKLDGPVIFGGDFNNPPIGKVYGTLKSGLTDSWRAVGSGTGWTIDANRPVKRVDYLLHNDYWRAVRAHVGNSVGSDHRVYWADFELVKPGKLDPNPIPMASYILPIPDELQPQVTEKEKPAPIIFSSPKPIAKSIVKLPIKPVLKTSPKKKVVGKKPSRRRSTLRRSKRRQRG